MNICIWNKSRSHSHTLSRERRKKRKQMTAIRNLTNLKYCISIFLKNVNMSKYQDVSNLDYGYMIATFLNVL